MKTKYFASLFVIVLLVTGINAQEPDSRSATPPQRNKTLGEVEDEMKEDLLEFRRKQAEQRMELAKKLLNERQYYEDLMRFEAAVDALANQGERDYYIGVQCEPAIEAAVNLSAFQEELNKLQGTLPDQDKLHQPNLGTLFQDWQIDSIHVQGGLRVNSIVEESPAHQAGLQEGDVIYRFRGEILSDVARLGELIDAAEEQSVSVEFIREGQVIETLVTPRRRQQPSNDQKGPAVEQAIKFLARGSKINPLMPGVPRASRYELPDGYEFNFQVKSGQPAVFKFSNQSGQTWTATENELSKLPVELQNFASRFIRPAWDVYPHDPKTFGMTDMAIQQLYTDSVQQAQQPTYDEMNQKIDELTDKVNRMSQALEALQDKN